MKRWQKVFFIVLLAVIAFGAGYWYTSRSPELTPAPDTPVRQATKPSVVVYVPHMVENRTEWEAKPVPVQEDEDALRVALEHLLITRDSPFPSDTRVLRVGMQNHLAEVDFSRELIDNFEGGSTSEAWILISLQKTLAQFTEVEKVQILVEGKKIDSIGGHFDVREPLLVREELKTP